MKRVMHLIGSLIVFSLCCGPLEPVDDTEGTKENDRLASNQKGDPEDENSEDSQESGFNQMSQKELIATTLEKMPWLEKNPACEGSVGENAIPDGYCDPTVDYESNDLRLAAKMEEMRDNPLSNQIMTASYDVHVHQPYLLARKEEAVSSDYKVTYPKDVRLISSESDPSVILHSHLREFTRFEQLCDNWCGPAAVQMIMYHFGVDLFQKDIAEALSTGDCNRGGGTALAPILNFLNKYLYRASQYTQVTTARNTCESYADLRLQQEPYVGDLIGRKTSNNAARLIGRVVQDVTVHNQPVLALINQTPKNEKYVFPGFIYHYDETRPDWKRNHYILLIGYRGSYNGKDDSAFFYFRESSRKRDGKKLTETVDVNTVVADLESNNGKGGTVERKWNVLW